MEDIFQLRKNWKVQSGLPIKRSMNKTLLNGGRNTEAQKET
jgi:hypothetical protein